MVYADLYRLGASGMTHNELLAEITSESADIGGAVIKALRAVVELHKPNLIPNWVPTEDEFICWCAHIYPCPTIQALEKELG